MFGVVQTLDSVNAMVGGGAGYLDSVANVATRMLLLEFVLVPGEAIEAVVTTLSLDVATVHSGSWSFGVTIAVIVVVETGFMAPNADGRTFVLGATFTLLSEVTRLSVAAVFVVVVDDVIRVADSPQVPVVLPSVAALSSDFILAKSAVEGLPLLS